MEPDGLGPGFIDVSPVPPPESLPNHDDLPYGMLRAPEMEGDPIPGVCWVCGDRVEDVRTDFEPYEPNRFDADAAGTGPGPHAHCAVRAEQIDAGLRHRPSGAVDVRTVRW